jgi:hypothetical protein
MVRGGNGSGRPFEIVVALPVEASARDKRRMECGAIRHGEVILRWDCSAYVHDGTVGKIFDSAAQDFMGKWRGVALAKEDEAHARL